MSDDRDPIEFGPVDDLGMRWDPEAARLALVLVAPGRIEILLTTHDPEWVREALATVTGDRCDIVIGYQSPLEEP